MDLHVLLRVAGDREDLRRGVVRVAVSAKVMRLALGLKWRQGGLQWHGRPTEMRSWCAGKLSSQGQLGGQILVEVVQHLKDLQIVTRTCSAYAYQQWRGSSSTRKTYSESLLEQSALVEERYVGNNLSRYLQNVLFQVTYSSPIYISISQPG